MEIDNIEKIAEEYKKTTEFREKYGTPVKKMPLRKYTKNGRKREIEARIKREARLEAKKIHQEEVSRLMDARREKIKEKKEFRKRINEDPDFRKQYNNEIYRRRMMDPVKREERRKKDAEKYEKSEYHQEVLKRQTPIISKHSVTEIG